MIAFRDKAVTKLETAGPTSLDVVVPAGTQNGDLLVLWIYATGNPVITPPAGWSKGRDGHGLTEQEDISSQAKMAMWHRIASSEPATHTFTFDIATRVIATMTAYSGALRTGEAWLYEPGGTGTTITTGATVAPVENAWLLTAAGTRKTADPGATFTVDEAGDVERSDDTTVGGTASNRPTLAVYDSNGPVAFATANDRVVTASAAPISGSLAGWYTELISDGVSGTGPIAFRGATYGAVSGASSTPINLSVPFVEDGDLILCFVHMLATGGVMTTVPAGMTRLERRQADSSADAVVYYKIANAEPDTITFAHSGSGTVTLQVNVVVYSGVNRTSPIGSFDSGWKSATGTIATTPAITTRQGGSWIISAAIGIDRGPFSTTDSLDVERLEADHGTYAAAVYDSSRGYAAGTTTARTLTTTSTGTGPAVWILEIRSGAGAQSVVPRGTGRTNPIKNPSFETNLTGYTFQSSTTQTRDTTEFLYGTASMKCVIGVPTRCAVYGATAGAAANADSIPVNPGALITISCYVKMTTTPVGLRCKIHWFTAAGAWISDSEPAFTTPTINTWTRFSATGAAPATARSYGVVLITNGGGTLYTDGWLAEESPIADVYFDGATTNGAYAHSWTGVAHASASRAVASGTRTNLLTNPSAETGIASWSGTSLGRTAADFGATNGAVSGGWYFDGPTAMESTKVPATAGLTYTASGYYTRGSGARTAAVTIHFFDASNVELSPPTITTTTVFTQNVPQRFASGRVAPTNTTQVAVRVTGSSNIVCFDAILLEQSEYLDSYFDGDTKSNTLTHAWTGTAHASTSTQVAGAPTDGTLVTVKSSEAGLWVSRVAVPRARTGGYWKVGNPKRWNGSAWVDLT